MRVECNLGDMDIGKEATIQMEVELNPTVLQLMPVSLSPIPPPIAQLQLSHVWALLGRPKSLGCANLSITKQR